MILHRTAAAMWIKQLLLLTLTSCCFASQTGDTIGQKLTDFLNQGVGVQEFQDYVDQQVTFVDETLDPVTLTKQVADSMSARLQARIDALTALRNEIENLYGSVSINNPYRTCCTVPLYERSPHLNNNMVNLNEMCTVGQQLYRATEFLPSSILNTVRTQYNTALGIKFAYFGSEEGVLFNYPSTRLCLPTYDPRFRPWYVETATPLPKDLVIVIDSSGSMTQTDSRSGESLMQIAKKAAITVIDTLNPNDNVGVVQFSSNFKTPPGTSSTSTCYRNQLAKATSENKDYLTRFINSVSANGGTIYSSAIKAAFQYFINTPQDVNDTRNRDKVILFLTDGVPNDSPQSTIYSAIAEENAKLNNSVIILTYGLGTYINKDILTKMANQISNDASFGETKRGIYTPVDDPTNLRSAMASYYEQFKETAASEVVFSVPYYDAFGTGLITSMCLPVTYQGALKGVTCFDLSVDDMLQDITYFKEAESTTGFLIDSTSRVLYHPLLKVPSEVTNNPKFIYLDTLEVGITDVTNSMKRGGNGTKVAPSQSILSRGNVLLEGTQRSSVASTYSWYPVRGTSFSVCLVVALGEHRANIQWTGPYPSFLYHKLNLNRATVNTCKQFTRVATKDKAGIFFAARCFKDPYFYLNTEETQNTLDEYDTYLTGTSSRNPGFKNGVREALAVTSKFDNILSTRGGDSLYAAWRYLATDNGILKNYPTIELPKVYDATRRSWFVRAKAFKGLMSISTPYVDAFGAGTVLSIHKVIYEGNKQGIHSVNDETIGVMGADFTLPYFYYTVIGSVQMCQTYTCFVLDKAGYIVSHKDWVSSARSTPKTANVHVSDYEPYIASELVRAGAMVPDGCINTDLLRTQYFTKVTAIADIINSKFELHVIQNSNIYLVIRKQSGSAVCYSCYSSYGACGFNFETRCFCPCYKKASVYKYCQGIFDLSSDTHQPCTPEIAAINFSSVAQSEQSVVQSLSNCTRYDCQSANKNSAQSCGSVVSCSWCQYDETGDSMTEPYCSTEAVCPFGSLRNAVDEDDGGGSGSLWWIALIVLAAVGIALAVYNRKLIRKKLPCVSHKASPPQNTTVAPPTAPGPLPQAPAEYTNLAYAQEQQPVAPPAYGDVFPGQPRTHGGNVY